MISRSFSPVGAGVGAGAAVGAPGAAVGAAGAAVGAAGAAVGGADVVCPHAASTSALIDQRMTSVRLSIHVLLFCNRIHEYEPTPPWIRHLMRTRCLRARNDQSPFHRGAQ